MNNEPISNPFDEDERSGRQPLFWSILSMGVLCILGYFAVMVYYYKPDPKAMINKYFATPTPTSTSTPTPTITPTPDIFLTAIQESNPIFKDGFDSNQNNWEAEFRNNTVNVANGTLILRSKEKGFVGTSYCSSCPDSGDSFYFQAKVFIRADTSQRFGLAFCKEPDSQNYYTFSINQKHNTFDFFKHSSRGWEILARNRSSPATKKYPDTNSLGVFFEHGKIILYVNNTLTYSYQDDKPFNCNRLGFFVSNGISNMYADDVEIYTMTAIPTPKP